MNDDRIHANVVMKDLDPVEFVHDAHDLVEAPLHLIFIETCKLQLAEKSSHAFAFWLLNDQIGVVLLFKVVNEANNCTNRLQVKKHVPFDKLRCFCVPFLAQWYHFQR